MPLRHCVLIISAIKIFDILHAFDRVINTLHKNYAIIELYFDPCLNLPVKASDFIGEEIKKTLIHNENFVLL